MSMTNTKIADIKLQDTVDNRCRSCFLKTYQHLFEKFNVEKNKRQKFISFFQETMINKKNLSSPEIQRILNNEFCRIIEVANPYKEEKKCSNSLAIKLYNEWKPKVLESDNPFNLALRLAIAGNIMDYGANNSFDIRKIINAVLKAPFAIDHSLLLQNNVKKAERILYLGDNAGEIVFDRLFIETIMHNNITYVVKGGPVLNDVTMTDAREAGMNKVSPIISNGYNAPSTMLQYCSNEFMEAYNNADVIISKGQGNYEGLMCENNPRIFFLLMVKCDVIAEKLNVGKGSFVVYNKPE